MEKNAIDYVFYSISFLLLLQLVFTGLVHQFITSNGTLYRKYNTPIYLKEGDVLMLCNCDHYNISPSLQHSPELNSIFAEDASAEIDEFLVLPNITEQKNSRVLEQRIRRKRLRLWEQGRQSRHRKAYTSSMEFGSTIKSTSVTPMLKDRLRIGISIRPASNQSVELELERSLVHKRINEFILDVFEAALKLLPYNLSYEKVPLYGSTDDLFKEVALKSIDAGVGDIIISAQGYELVEFSQPYVEARLVMLVSTTTTDKQLTWLFMSLFTPWMWFLLAATSFFTGFVLCLLENQNHNDSTGGSPARRIAIAFSFAFATLYYGQRERPNSSLSLFVLLPWLLLMLVVSTTFTNSFTSSVANSYSEPSKTDINLLRRTNAAIGCDGNQFSIHYLVNVLGFKAKNIRSIDSVDDYAKLLSSGNIEVAFILMPYAKVFLAKYCKGFAISGPTYELGGFGFVFPKGSILALDMSQAIVRLRERGDLRLIEEEMVSSFNCSASPSGTSARQSLGPEPFLGFFIISGSASAIALLIIVIRVMRQQWDKWTNIQAYLMGRGLWICLATIFTQNQTSRSSVPQTEG